MGIPFGHYYTKFFGVLNSFYVMQLFSLRPLSAQNGHFFHFWRSTPMESLYVDKFKSGYMYHYCGRVLKKKPYVWYCIFFLYCAETRIDTKFVLLDLL